MGRGHSRDFNGRDAVSPNTEFDRTSCTAVEEARGEMCGKPEKVNIADDWCREGHEKQKEKGDEEEDWGQRCDHCEGNLSRGLWSERGVLYVLATRSIVPWTMTLWLKKRKDTG